MQLGNTCNEEQKKLKRERQMSTGKTLKNPQTEMQKDIPLIGNDGVLKFSKEMEVSAGSALNQRDS